MTGEELKALAHRSYHMAGLMRELDRQLRQLEEERKNNQALAEGLEKRNLKNLVGTFLGRTGKQLREAQLQLYMLDKKREELTRRKAALEEERSACEAVLALPMDETAKALVELCRLEDHGRSITAAIRQGDAARELCKGLRLTLEQAQEYGWLDATSRSYAAHDAKHAKLSDVQAMVDYLREQMEKFDFSLEPLGKTLETWEMPEIRRCLYDGLILDWILLKRIDDALGQVKNIGRYLSETVWQLERLRKENDMKMEALRQGGSASMGWKHQD